MQQKPELKGSEVSFEDNVQNDTYYAICPPPIFMHYVIAFMQTNYTVSKASHSGE
jgi:hypothetical protein